MKHEKKLSSIFDEFKFPNIDKPIAYNADSDNLSTYMKRLSSDKDFLAEEAEKLGKEVSEMLEELEQKGIVE